MRFKSARWLAPLTANAFNQLCQCANSSSKLTVPAVMPSLLFPA